MAISLDSAAVQASPSARDALGTIFALDRRHDNPDRDGKWSLRLVTNEETVSAGQFSLRDRSSEST